MCAPHTLKRTMSDSFRQAHPIDTMRIPQIAKGIAPFHVKIEVRSPAHAALIERDCLDAVNAP